MERLLFSIAIAALVALAYRLLTRYHRRRVDAGARGAPGRPQLLYFRGQGCPACAAQARYLDKLDADLQALVTTIDVEQDPETARRYNVLTLPTTIIVDRAGDVRHINYGLASAAKLSEQLSARSVGQYSLALQHYDKEVRTMSASQRDHVAFLLGRVMLGGMYLYSGITNVIELHGKAEYAASKGLPAPEMFVTLASLLLLAGGISIVTGLRPRLGVAAIALFLIPVGVIMHNFWALEGIQRMSELHAFLGNLGLLGSALIFLAIPQPWPLSLDSWLASLGGAEHKQRATNTA